MMRGKLGGGLPESFGPIHLCIYALFVLVAVASWRAHAQMRQDHESAPSAAMTNAGWARRAGWTNRPPITDLGVMTADTMIMLQKCERRTDFAAFKVEVLPRNRRGWTNKVSFSTTNEVLKLDDFAAVPDGVAIIGVRQICADNAASPLALYRVDIQRDPPDAPRAYKTHILRNQSEQKIEHVIENIEAAEQAPAPPTPPGMVTPKSPVPTRSYAEPLPGGVGETYSQYQARLERAARSGERIKNMR